MAAERSRPNVGFDLDLTLIDPRPGMIGAFRALNAEFRSELDGESFAANLGPPLPDVLRGYGYDEPMVDKLVHCFRELYPDIVIGATQPMRGAERALAAVRAAGGRALVVTGRYEPNAALHLKALGWEVDHLSGDVFASAKGSVLREESMSIYVGDHLGDITGAKEAGATAVGVATGPFGPQALREAGADVVLTDLTGFPAWFAARSSAPA